MVLQKVVAGLAEAACSQMEHQKLEAGVQVLAEVLALTEVLDWQMREYQLSVEHKLYKLVQPCPA